MDKCLLDFIYSRLCKVYKEGEKVTNWELSGFIFGVSEQYGSKIFPHATSALEYLDTFPFLKELPPSSDWRYTICKGFKEYEVLR